MFPFTLYKQEAPCLLHLIMGRQGATVRDVEAAEFITAFAAHLKRAGNIELPKWVDLVKTAHFKELSPSDPDWYYTRCAAIARKVYLRKGLGTGSLKRLFGASKNRGTVPSHSATASGAVIRHAVHQLEKLGLIETVKGGKGRQITSEGQRALDSIACQLTA